MSRRISFRGDAKIRLPEDPSQDRAKENKQDCWISKTNNISEILVKSCDSKVIIFIWREIILEKLSGIQRRWAWNHGIFNKRRRIWYLEKDIDKSKASERIPTDSYSSFFNKNRLRSWIFWWTLNR